MMPRLMTALFDSPAKRTLKHVVNQKRTPSENDRLQSRRLLSLRKKRKEKCWSTLCFFSSNMKMPEDIGMMTEPRTPR